eukprot:gene33626-41488_t
MPDGAEAPELLDAVAEANNWIPPLWQVMLSAGAAGPAQDAQQVFLPSVSDGVYAERAEAERRAGVLLDFVASHPMLEDAERYAESAATVKRFLAGCEGTAYTADLNEYFMLDGSDAAGFLADCARIWDGVQQAAASGSHAALNGLLQFRADDASASLGLDLCCQADDGGFGDDDDNGGDEPDGDAVEIFEQQGLYGLRKYDGTVLLEPCLDALYDFDDDSHLAVARVGALFGYLRRDGSWAVAPRFSDAFDHEAGLARVLTAEGLGLIGVDGALVLAPGFVELEHHGMLKAWVGRRAGEAPLEVYFEDGQRWFVADCDEIEELRYGGDALLRKGKLAGSWQRNGAPGLPLAFEKLSVLAEPDDCSPGYTRTVFLAVPSKKAKLAGAFLPDGSTLIPVHYTKIEAWRVDCQRGQPTRDGQYDGVPQFFQVQRGAKLFGVWSADAGREILPCEFDKGWLLFDGRRVRLLMRRPGQGYQLHDEQGLALGPGGYQALNPDPEVENDGWGRAILAREITDDWAAGRGAFMWRGGQGWRLYADGREEADFDYQMRLALGGSAKACMALAAIFEGGRGVPADPVQVFYWVGRAAKAGDKDARLLQAEFLEDGVGCRQDLAAARGLYESLVDDHWQAANAFAIMLLNGEGGHQDQVRARAIFTGLAERGEYCSALPQRNVGICWLRGQGGPADRQVALDYFEKSARSNSYREADGAGCLLAGDVHAELALEASQAGERGAHAKATKRSRHYYALAIENGCADGHLGLARLHLGESGGERDDVQARECLRAALEEEDTQDEARELLREYGLRA